jgi:hypothetical protein
MEIDTFPNSSFVWRILVRFTQMILSQRYLYFVRFNKSVSFIVGLNSLTKQFIYDIVAVN